MSVTSSIRSSSLLQFLAYGSVLSTYVLIVIGGYVTTTNSGAACGSSPGAESWPLCNGNLFPNLANTAQVIEYTHRTFNLVVAFFVLGTALLAWARYRRENRIVQFSTAGFLGLVAQVILGMATVTTDLNPVVSDAHLALASAVFGLLVINAVNVWNFRQDSVEFGRRNL